MAYSTKINLNSKNKKFASKNRVKGSSTRNFSSKKWSRGKSAKNSKKSLFARLRQKNVKKFLYSAGAVLMIFIVVGLIFALAYVQAITQDLPSPDKPFGVKSTSSEILDKNGKLLYKLFGDENRDPVDIDEVPLLLQWAVLAAEDIDFYSHPGVDLTGIIRCGVINLREGSTSCGGSTITQQLIKQTSLSSEQRIERKVKEIILALQIERERSKEEILEMYLTVMPEGSNIYGVTTASKFYFDKNLDELNLAQMAILASIPQSPSKLSPTKSANTELAQKNVKNRQLYVLDQMENYIDLINQQAREQNGVDSDILTREMIEEARAFELEYKSPRFEIKAPHFVFYVEQQLQSRDYNDGFPFDLIDLETGGYKIYTTLDLDIQQIAEEQVKKGVENQGKTYGAENASLIAMIPKTGEIVAMVGSKDYFGEASPTGCTQGLNCKFEPSVNITNTLQSIGSSMKPMVYYQALLNGLITPASIIPDIPIKIGNYEPKNYEGGFYGLNSARVMLKDSRNIPAIYLVDKIGVGSFVEEMQKWGYTTLNNPAGYGPSISVGGSDIKLIDHAQAYGVFANGGELVKHEVISKIVDKEGNVVYEYEPASERVADERAIYIINDMLNGKKGGPGDSWDGRDISGKTGTSEYQRETIFATYTPEIVAVGWLGNNNNEGMRYGASGFTSARPWVSEFMRRIGGSFPKTEFFRPAGVTATTGCEELDGASCAGISTADLAINGIAVPKYVQIKKIKVCKDQPDKLARDVDIALNMYEEKEIKIYSMPNEKLTSFLEDYLQKNPDIGVVNEPTEYCDAVRNPGGSLEPWAVFINPIEGMVIEGTSLEISFNVFTSKGTITKAEIYFNNELLDTVTNLPHAKTYEIESLSAGVHKLSIKAFDSEGKIGNTTINIEKLGVIEINSPINGSNISAGTSYPVEFVYSGSQLNTIELLVNGSSVGASCQSTQCIWEVPEINGNYTLQIIGKRKTVSIESNVVTFTVT